MLSNEEKKEMLEDSRSHLRRENFRAIREKSNQSFSFDEYILFLNSIQRLFSQFKISRHITADKFNKL